MFLLCLWVFARCAESQEPTASSFSLTGTNNLPSSIANLGGDVLPTGSDVTYLSLGSTITLNGTVADIASTFVNANFSTVSSSSTRTSSSPTVSILRGTYGSPDSPVNGTRTANATANRKTSTSAQPTNTQPCNNYPEFCARQYSNITFVAAHNSPFVAENNAAANQLLGVTDQLNDGIRMLQGQTHYNSTTDTISYCHTSCDLLNAGTAESYFRQVSRWVRRHPFDVVTLLMGNSDFVNVDNYTAPLSRSGLSRYAYVPPEVPMSLSAWPTLGEMILTQKRVVIFMDYNANQVSLSSTFHS